MEQKIMVLGGCHCGAVRFRARLNRESEVQICNCSICSMCGFEHLIVPGKCFELISEPADLSEYQFNSQTARHLFCSVCGVKSFYVPRSNPDGYSLNVRCLELPREIKLRYSLFDGRNWSENAQSLSHLSETEGD